MYLITEKQRNAVDMVRNYLAATRESSSTSDELGIKLIETAMKAFDRRADQSPWTSLTDAYYAHYVNDGEEFAEVPFVPDVHFMEVDEYDEDGTGKTTYLTVRGRFSKAQLEGDINEVLKMSILDIIGYDPKGSGPCQCTHCANGWDCCGNSTYGKPVVVGILNEDEDPWNVAQVVVSHSMNV